MGSFAVSESGRLMSAVTGGRRSTPSGAMGESAGTGPVRDLATRGSATASDVGHQRPPTLEQHAWTRPRRRMTPNALVLLGKAVPVILGATAGPSSAVV